MLKSCRALLSVLVILLVMAWSGQAQAAVYTWDNGAVGDSWTTDGNWDIAGNPSAIADEAILPNIAGAYTVSLGSTRTIGKLTISGSQPTLDLSANLDVEPGADLGSTSSNAGTIDINNRQLWIQTDTFTQSGTINASGGILRFGWGGAGNQTADVDTVVDWTAGSDITDPYTFWVESAAEVTVNRSSTWNFLSGQTLQLGVNRPGSNSDITVLTLDQDMTNSGSIQMGTPPTGYSRMFMTINSTDSKLTNNSDGLIEMYPRYDGTNGGFWSYRNLEAELINAGDLIVYTNEAYLGKAVAGIDHVNTGTITFDSQYSGAILANVSQLDVSGDSLTNAAAGTIDGNGILDVSGITGGLTNDGTLSPGLSAGILNVTGSVTNASTSQLVIELGGTTLGTIEDEDTDYDQLNISQTFAIDGELLVTLINGLENSIANGDSFTIVTFNSSTGTFNNLFDTDRVLAFDDEGEVLGSFLLTINSGNLVLSDFAEPPVPEPSSLVLLGLGMFGLVRHTRRRRRV